METGKIVLSGKMVGAGKGVGEEYLKNRLECERHTISNVVESIAVLSTGNIEKKYISLLLATLTVELRKDEPDYTDIMAFIDEKRG